MFFDLFIKQKVVYNENYHLLMNDIVTKVFILMKNGRDSMQSYDEIFNERYSNDLNKIQFIKIFLFTQDPKKEMEHIILFHDNFMGLIYRMIHCIFVLDNSKINIMEIYNKNKKKAFKIMEPDVSYFNNVFIRNFRRIQNEVFK